MNKYFEGDYRRTPEQNLAGASRQHGKMELLNRVQSERRKREEQRIISEKITIIQSVIRGFLTRRRLRQIWKIDFHSKLSTLQTNGEIKLDDLAFLLKRLPHICQPHNLMDMNPSVLVLLLKLIKERSIAVMVEMSLSTVWLWRMVYFLEIIIYLIRLDPKYVNDKMLILNFVRIFTDYSVYRGLLQKKDCDRLLNTVIRHIMKHPFFDMIVHILEKEVMLQGSVQILLKQLLHFINETPDNELRIIGLKCMSKTFLCPPLAETTRDSVVGILNESADFYLPNLLDAFSEVDDKCYTSNAFYCFLCLDNNQNAIPDHRQQDYFHLLSKFSHNFVVLNKHVKVECEEQEFDMDSSILDLSNKKMIERCFAYMNNNERTEVWLDFLNKILDKEDHDALLTFCKCVHRLWLPRCRPVYFYSITRRLVFHNVFLRHLWEAISQLKRESLFSSSVPLLTILARGALLLPPESDLLVPSLSLFCYFLRSALCLLEDDLLYDEEMPSSHKRRPFSIPELAVLSKTLKEIGVGLISLAFPDTNSFSKENRIQQCAPTRDIYFNTLAWKCLLKEIFSVLSLLQIRDCRRQFTFDASHWLSNSVTLAEYKNIPFSYIENFEKVEPFAYPGAWPRSASHENRVLCTLKNMPYTLEFLKRFALFHHLLIENKSNFQDVYGHFLQFPHIMINIRRDYLYEDAFNRLSVDEVPEVRVTIRIHMSSWIGAEEPGVDGGGIFREFITELLITAFDPNRGFFLFNKNNELYPNPNISLIEPDYIKHYFFIGRMLGKAIYEGMLVDIPLAELFLLKMMGRSFDMYVNSLYSLDPDFCKNLILLASYKHEQLAELGLDFTLTLNEYGQNEIIELKQGGRNILVNPDNVLEYIYLVAYYKAERQIKPQCDSFLEGLGSVIPLDWLGLFSTAELQRIISGNESPIDVEDMKTHTVYSGGFSIEHPNIQKFWNVVSTMNNEERSKLLKFVTSYSRPPLLGFKELYPPFCIQYVEGVEDHLPTSSTCMNILKLPLFSTEDIMRDKLLYAIQSLSGFELI